MCNGKDMQLGIKGRKNANTKDTKLINTSQMLDS
jgi:hypothetical protein